MLTCREFVEFLADYLAGELPTSARAEFDRHLAGCEDCPPYLRTYQETIRLGQAAYADPDGGVTEDAPEELVRAIIAVRESTHLP